MNALYEWYAVSQQLTKLKEREIELRREIFNEYFPEPKEGTNKVAIEGNATLVAQLPYNYTIDEDTLDAALELIPKTKQEKIVTWKPYLAKSVYNTLSKKAKTAFTAECVTVKPGTPSLTIKAAPAES